jgi:hypothetical protein
MHLSRQSIRTVATHEALIESDKRVKQGGTAMTDEELLQATELHENAICALSQYEMFLLVHAGLEHLVKCPSHMPKVFELNPDLNSSLTTLLEQDQANLREADEDKQ